MLQMIADYPSLLKPQKLWTRAEILGNPCPVPKVPGVYAWYFQAIPSQVPIAHCHVHNDFILLYIGISPKKPPQNGKPPSRHTIYNRLRYHLKGNAKGSTLRLTLGCLLSDTLGIQLRRIGSGTRMTFANGERVLNAWLDQCAYITWMQHPQPWLIEEELIQKLSLPLNLDQNNDHDFHSHLTQLRRDARERAKVLPVIDIT
jgi:hypothetical protein